MPDRAPLERAAPRILRGRGCRLVLDRPQIMGVLNVTPDSFYDGSCHVGVEGALAHARAMVAAGADLIDVGGESTRPGAAAVGVEEEIARVVPVIERLRRELPQPISIDTHKSAVARAAVAAGADFVNDISGLSFDPAMAATVAASGAGLFLMHTRGRPERMQADTDYRDLIGEIYAWLSSQLAVAEAAGIPADKLALDPGIGFGKSVAGNLEILRRLDAFLPLGRPLLLGTSRKSFIGQVLGQSDPATRLYGSLATVALGVAKGARLFRVHDVGPSREAALMAWAVSRGSGWSALDCSSAMGES